MKKWVIRIEDAVLDYREIEIEAKKIKGPQSLRVIMDGMGLTYRDVISISKEER